MIDPKALEYKTIVYIRDQEEWDEFQEAMRQRGARHHEDKFDTARPYRWIDHGKTDLEWYKGTKSSAFDGPWKDWSHIDFCDLETIQETTFDTEMLSSLIDLM